MGSKNGTWLRYMKATLDPLQRLALLIQGEKGIDILATRIVLPVLQRLNRSW